MVLGNPMMYVLLARAVSLQWEYVDVIEVRTNPLAFWLFDPTGTGTIIGELSQAEMLEKLASWPIRVPRHDEPRLPYGALTEQGQAWLGPVPGVVA
jgi:hypothetical protein